MNELPGQGRNHRIVARLLELMRTDNIDDFADVWTEDAVADMPQTGERVRGLANLRAVYKANPVRGPGSAEQLEVLGEEPRYVMTPTFNLVRVEGTGDNVVAIAKIHYGDGSEWWLVNLLTLRGEKVAKVVQYWAPVFPAPEWRAPWVEAIE